MNYRKFSNIENKGNKNRARNQNPSSVPVIFFAIQSLTGLVLYYFYQNISMLAAGLTGAVFAVSSCVYHSAAHHSFSKPDLFGNSIYNKYLSISRILVSGISAIFLIIILIMLLKMNVTESNSDFTYYIYIYIFISLAATIWFIFRLPKSAVHYLMPVYSAMAEDLKPASHGFFILLIAYIISQLAKISDNQFIFLYAEFIGGIAVFAFLFSKHISKIRLYFDILLDREVSDDIQYDVISVLADFMKHMCEFRSLHFRRLDDGILVEFDIVLPPDSTIESKSKLEAAISRRINELYPDTITRIYAVPCNSYCMNSLQNCKIKNSINEID